VKVLFKWVVRVVFWFLGFFGWFGGLVIGWFLFCFVFWLVLSFRVFFFFFFFFFFSREIF